LTDNVLIVNLSPDELRLVELFREALAKRYAEVTFVIHNGELASASLTEKFKF
jgi:hypothetical protein